MVVERLRAAMNARDIDAFVACFAEGYDSKQPAHPDRAFTGRDQVRENWSAIFEGVPDFTAELVAAATDGETEWCEWHWRGTHGGGTKLDMAGVIVAGIDDGVLQWAPSTSSRWSRRAPASRTPCARCRARAPKCSRVGVLAHRLAR